MDSPSRRAFIADTARLTIAALVFPLSAWADGDCRVPHPLSPPDPVFHGRCPNCGMMRSMWARTWKTFRLADRMHEACSFHCLADLVAKSGERPREVMTALFLQPRGMLPAEAAWYVVGSSARGTMTTVSKAAFAGRAAAADFARICGGGIQDYAATYRLAGSTLARENAMIDKKRLAGRKIVPPVDMQDECVVCRMYPSRYPLHRSQVAYRNGRVDHFCSTHCLFVWLGDVRHRKALLNASAMIWVVDFASGRWISGRTAYYVVDSRFMGPMGAEAVAFDRRARATEFARREGGRVLGFDQVGSGSATWGPPS